MSDSNSLFKKSDICLDIGNCEISSNLDSGGIKIQ